MAHRLPTTALILLLSLASISLCQPAYSQAWLNEVNHALDLAKNVSDERQMTLTGYKHLGTVDSEKDKLAVLDEVFADDAVTVVNSQEIFSLVKWDDNRVFTSEDRDKFRKRVYNAIARERVDVLEMNWTYKNQTYCSTALTGGDGIIYDNIISFAIDYSANAEKKETTVKLTRPIPDEWIDLIPRNMAGDKRVATFVASEYIDGQRLLTGKYAWHYRYRFVSAFDYSGLLLNRSSSENSESEIGWLCGSGSQIQDGELGKTKYQEYRWAWEYGDEHGSKYRFMKTLTHEP